VLVSLTKHCSQVLSLKYPALQDLEDRLSFLSRELQDKVRNICQEHLMSLEQRLLRSEDALKRVLADAPDLGV
jgi:hypothetical protein